MKFVISDDLTGGFRWLLYGTNGRLLAHSVGKFSTINECMDAILAVKKCSTAQVDDQTKVTNE